MNEYDVMSGPCIISTSRIFGAWKQFRQPRRESHNQVRSQAISYTNPDAYTKMMIRDELYDDHMWYNDRYDIVKFCDYVIDMIEFAPIR